MKSVDTLSTHLDSPDESLRSYLRRKRLELAGDIRYAKKVYLDTKFWIMLRDVRLGRRRQADEVRLLELLEGAVAQGRAICPISATIFMELLLQADPATGHASARLIDDLSRGVAIIEPSERALLEVLHFLRRKTYDVEAVHPIEDLIWAKSAYVMGFTAPTCEFFPPEIDLAIQKAMLDQMWLLGVTDMLDSARNQSASLAERCPDISGQLNRGKTEHRHENNFFKQLFLSELWGALDVFADRFGDMLIYMFRQEPGDDVRPDEATRRASARMVAKVIYKVFQLNKVTKELPSLWIGAGFHAAVRWDAQRKFKRNDLPDFRHAMAAIPYCDVFLTEKSLRHLVSHKQLRLEELFPCKTFSDASAAVEHLGPVCESA